MPLPRHDKLLAALAAALIGLPALPAAAQGPPQPPPPMQLAVLPRRTRLGRRWRHAAVRMIRSRRLRERMGWSRPGGLNPRPRLPTRESHARGPPPPRRRPRRPIHL